MDDISFCKLFLIGVNVGIVEEDIRKRVRLGKRNSDNASPISILVELGRRHMNYLVIESLYNGNKVS